METINWTREKLFRLKIEYMKAKLTNDKTFTFEGHEFVADWAKYLIEYLEQRLD